MNKKTYCYNAIEILSKDKKTKTYLTSIPAIDLNNIAGVPKKTVGGLGFQRTYQDKRTESLKSFYKKKENVILNPLLCGIQDSSSFEFKDGKLNFNLLDHSDMGHLELINLVQDNLSRRFDNKFSKIELTDEDFEVIKKDYISILAEIENDSTLINLDEEDEELDNEDEDEEDDIESYEKKSLNKLSSKSISNDEHVKSFFKDCILAKKLLQDPGLDPINSDALSILLPSMNEELLVEFLKPMNVIDGQHRLKGYIKMLEESFEYLDVDELEKLEKYALSKNELYSEMSPNEKSVFLKECFFRNESIHLPVSIFANESWPEHVFQFIVVNQKATTIPERELGSMLSTTLDTKEVEEIQGRLINSDIPIEDYQAILYFVSNENSPFFHVVDVANLKGKGPSGKKFQYKSFKNLINNIRGLCKISSYENHESYIRDFKQDSLFLNSGVVANYSQLGYESQIDYWSSIDGPWKDFFLRFFTFIKKYFSSDDSIYVSWSNINKSNIFNEVFLNILVSDFFRFLIEKDYTIDSWEGDDRNSLESILNKWIENPRKITKSVYISSLFNNEWKLLSKKSDDKLRKKWATNWFKLRFTKKAKAIPKKDWETPDA